MALIVIGTLTAFNTMLIGGMVDVIKDTSWYLGCVCNKRHCKNYLFRAGCAVLYMAYPEEI